MLKRLGILTSVLAVASFFCPTQAKAGDFHHGDRDGRSYYDHDNGRHERDWREDRRERERREEWREHERREWREREYRNNYYNGYRPYYRGSAYYYAPAPCPPRAGFFFSLGR